jgi:hypothetical protein
METLFCPTCLKEYNKEGGDRLVYKFCKECYERYTFCHPKINLDCEQCGAKAEVWVAPEEDVAEIKCYECDCEDQFLLEYEEEYLRPHKELIIESKEFDTMDWTDDGKFDYDDVDDEEE